MFFFDEAHLLFNDAPKALLEKVEQVVRLIRSKGVGVYFVTQNPLDVPDTVLGQLGNRVQHALRAFTPRDQKAVQGGGRDVRANPDARTERGDHRSSASARRWCRRCEPGGTPSIVEQAKICPPRARLGPVTPAERAAVQAQSPVKGSYDVAIDRNSAFEMLQRRTAETAAAPNALSSTSGADHCTRRFGGCPCTAGPATPVQPGRWAAEVNSGRGRRARQARLGRSGHEVGRTQHEQHGGPPGRQRAGAWNSRWSLAGWTLRRPQPETTVGVE